MTPEEKESDKKIIAAAHQLLQEIQNITHVTDKDKLTLIAIGAIFNVAKAFKCDTFEIKMQLRKLMGF
jgi:hypothetical protein